jgi:hypothetical protein
MTVGSSWQSKLITLWPGSKRGRERAGSDNPIILFKGTPPMTPPPKDSIISQ